MSDLLRQVWIIFAGKYILGGEDTHLITVEEATAIYNYLVRNEYVDDQGEVTDAYRVAAAGSGQFCPS